MIQKPSFQVLPARHIDPGFRVEEIIPETQSSVCFGDRDSIWVSKIFLFPPFSKPSMNAVRILLSVKFSLLPISIFSLLPISIFSYSTVAILYPVIMEEAYGDYRESSGKRASETIVGTGIRLVVLAERN